MDNELFELCKQVYDATGWKQSLNISQLYEYWDEHDELCVISIEDADDALVPAYTSDYLLEKLPSNIYLIKFTGDKVDGAYRAVRESEPFHPKNTMTAHAYTPLKALLKLTLALSESGELK